VETEVNELVTYYTAIIKMDGKRITAANRRLQVRPGEQIWLRRTFELLTINLGKPQVVVYANLSKVTLYLNGQPVTVPQEIDGHMLNAGRNRLTAYCESNRSCGYYIDAHLVDMTNTQRVISKGYLGLDG